MSSPTPTRRQTATGTPSTQPRNLQQHPAKSEAVSEEAWHTNSQAVIPDSKVLHRGALVDHAQLNQNHTYQQHQQYQWQQIPPVPVVPQQGPMFYSAPSFGVNQFQTLAQPQQPIWHFLNEPGDFGLGEVEFPVDLKSSPSPAYTPATASYSFTDEARPYYQALTRPLPKPRPQYDASRSFINPLDPNTYASPNFVHHMNPRPEPAQDQEVAKNHTGHWVNCVDMTSSYPPPAYPATASFSSLYHLPRPQWNGLPNYATLSMFNQSEEDLRVLPGLIEDSDMGTESEREDDEEESEEDEQYKKEEYEEEKYEEEECKEEKYKPQEECKEEKYKPQEECKEEKYKPQVNKKEEYKEEYEEEKYKKEEYVKAEYPTPTSPPPTYTTAASTPKRQPKEEEEEEEEAELSDDQTFLDDVLGIYEDTWKYKTKPAITAALYKYKRHGTRYDRIGYVLRCLEDMMKVNSDEFQPPTRINIVKKRRRDSSSSSDILFDSEEDLDDERQSESSSSSSGSSSSGGGGGKRRRLDNNSTKTTGVDETEARFEKTGAIKNLR